MTERKYHDVFHCVLKAKEGAGHVEKETRRDKRGETGSEDIKHGGTEGMLFVSKKRRLGPVVGECDSDGV